MANLQRVTYRGWPKSMVGGSVLHVEGSSRRWKDVVTSGKIYIHVVLICMANSYLDRCRCGAGFCCDCGKLLTACQCGPIAYEDPRDDPIHDEHFWGEHYRYTDMSEFAADDFVCEGYNQTFVRNQIVSCTQCHHLFLCAGCKPHWTVESVTKHLSEHFHEKHSSWAEVVLTEGERNGCAGCHRGGKELEARCSDCGLQFCSRCRSIWTASEDQERIGGHFKEGHDLYWEALATLRRARVVPATRFSQIVRLRNATIATCESVYGARLVGTFMTMMTIRMKLQAKMRMRMHGTDTWTPEDRSGLPLTGLMVIVGVAMVVGAGMSLVVDRGQDDDVGDEFDEAV